MSRFRKAFYDVLGLAAFLANGCGGTLSTTPSDAQFARDAGAPLDADASALDEDAGGAVDGPRMQDVGPFPPDALGDGAESCECRNLDACCHQAAQSDNGIACGADVARGDEAVCRMAILAGRYGCLGLGFVPRCSPADIALCPTTTTRCTSCLTAIRNCGPAIQCLTDSACRPIWDAVVACDQAGRPFFECFQILASKGNAPGELVLRGAQCIDTCQSDR